MCRQWEHNSLAATSGNRPFLKSHGTKRCGRIIGNFLTGFFVYKFVSIYIYICAKCEHVFVRIQKQNILLFNSPLPMGRFKPMFLFQPSLGSIPFSPLSFCIGTITELVGTSGPTHGGMQQLPLKQFFI